MDAQTMMMGGGRAEGNPRPADPDRWWRAVRWQWVAIGFLTAFMAGALFAIGMRAAGEWEHGLAWERALLLRLDPTLPRWVDAVLLTLPWLGTNITLMPFVAAAAAWLWFRMPRRRAVALQLVVVQLGSFALNLLLKALFDRPRPDLWPKRGQFALASFPSGHAIASVSVLLTVALLLARAGHRAAAAALVVLVLISLYSRLYLGVHWPTDVLAGAVIGAIWLVATLKAFR